MHRYLLLCMMSLLLASCTQSMYFPDRVNSPGFKEKGEAKLVLATKFTSNDADSLNRGWLNPAADIAYAVSNHIAVFASYRSLQNRYIREHIPDEYGKSRWSNDTIMGGRFTGNYFDAGAGYFSGIGGRAKMEVYGGIGMGNLNRNGTLMPQLNYDARYYRVFIQPAIGAASRQDVFSVMAGMRLTFQKFYAFSSPNPQLYYRAATISSYDAYDVRRPLYTFLEPFANLELGYKFIKVNMQLGLSVPLSGRAVDIAGFSPLFGSLGLAFNYAPRYFK